MKRRSLAQLQRAATLAVAGFFILCQALAVSTRCACGQAPAPAKTLSCSDCAKTCCSAEVELECARISAKDDVPAITAAVAEVPGLALLPRRCELPIIEHRTHNSRKQVERPRARLPDLSTETLRAPPIAS